jgi:nicotinamide-nucleotide adenylyltransferase
MGIESLGESIREVIEITEPNGPPTINFVKRAKRGIKAEKQKLGVFPSSFNPLTEAHSEIIKRAEEHGMDEILLLLDKRNADKEIFEVSLEDRLLMVLLFFENEEQISIGLSSHALFVDKIEALRRIYPPTTNINFIVGYDTMVRILDKKYYRDREAALDSLFAKSRFLIAKRNDKGRRAIFELFEREENKRFKHRIEILEISPSAASISATEVREKVKKGEPIEGLVPEKIVCLIKEMHLYQCSRGNS